MDCSNLSAGTLMKAIAKATPDELLQYRDIAYDWYGPWPWSARPEQRPPDGEWRFWVYLAGRGAGKTRAGAEWVRWLVDRGETDIGLIAPTAGDVSAVMINGQSGIMNVFPPHQRPVFVGTNRTITFHTGAVAHTYSADVPDRLRGPQHRFIWADELCAWRYDQYAWDMAMFGLRLGANPQAFVSTTPRPTPLLKSLVAHPATVLTRGTTFDNRQNLAAGFFSDILDKYEGTRLGRQEIYAEIISDNPDALWRRTDIDKHRVTTAPEELEQVVVAIDPAATATGDETGIVVAARGTDKRYYVLADASLHGTPDQWARRAVDLYDEYRADKIVYESNQGGDMVRYTLRTVRHNLPVKPVHASRGKFARAEPVAALYEQGKVSHVGQLNTLEDQMCEWTPEMKYSPDRMDALVWAISALMRRQEQRVEVIG